MKLLIIFLLVIVFINGNKIKQKHIRALLSSKLQTKLEVTTIDECASYLSVQTNAFGTQSLGGGKFVGTAPACEGHCSGCYNDGEYTTCCDAMTKYQDYSAAQGAFDADTPDSIIALVKGAYGSPCDTGYKALCLLPKPTSPPTQAGAVSLGTLTGEWAELGSNNNPFTYEITKGTSSDSSTEKASSSDWSTSISAGFSFSFGGAESSIDVSHTASSSVSQQMSNSNSFSSSTDVTFSCPTDDEADGTTFFAYQWKISSSTGDSARSDDFFCVKGNNKPQCPLGFCGDDECATCDGSWKGSSSNDGGDGFNDGGFNFNPTPTPPPVPTAPTAPTTDDSWW